VVVVPLHLLLTPFRSAKWQSISNIFVNSGSVTTYEADASATRRLETARCAATDELCVAIRAVADLEAKLNIERTWTEDDPEYREVEKYLRHQEFHRALDRVQQLVVQRLFEMSKANIAGMGKLLIVISTMFYIMITQVTKCEHQSGKP